MKLSPTVHDLAPHEYPYKDAFLAQSTFSLVAAHEIEIIADDEIMQDKRVTAYVEHKTEAATSVVTPNSYPSVGSESSDYDLVLNEIDHEAAQQTVFPTFINATAINTIQSGIFEASRAPIDRTDKTPFWKKAAAAVTIAAAGITVAANAAPASAETGTHATVTADGNEVSTSELAKMSAAKAYNTCKKNVLVVAHTAAAGEGAKTKFDVNSVKWIEHSIKEGHVRIELDLQPATDGVGLGIHNRTYNDETTGTGVVTSKDSAYAATLKTPHGEHVSTQDDYITVLQQNPDIDFQMEWKDYDNKWTGDRIDAVIAKFAEAGVLGQLHFSSASTKIIRYLHEKYPELNDLQLIGFANYLPNLKVAKKIGATQVNVTSEAALRGGARYMKMAKKMGIQVSVRSRPTGEGDDGQTWLAAVENGADQIVTQGATKYFVCSAVRKAASNRG